MSTQYPVCSMKASFMLLRTTAPVSWGGDSLGADYHKRQSGPLLRNFKGDYDPKAALTFKPTTLRRVVG